jgi:hypothetical protein
MPGVRGNFFGRLPGPRLIGPVASPADSLLTGPIGWPATTLVRTPLQLGRQTKYKLWPPTVVNYPPFAPVRVYLADQKHPPRKTNYRLGSPVVVHPAIPARLRVYLAEPQPLRRTHSRLAAPVTPTTTFVATPVRVTLTQAKRPARGTIYRLGAPVVVALRVALADPIRVTLAPSRRPKTWYQLAPPTILAAPTPFLPSPIRRTLAKAEPPRRGTIYKLGVPTLVAAPFVPPPAVVTGVDDFTPIMPTMM